jgi:hypothetical protein
MEARGDGEYHSESPRPSKAVPGGRAKVFYQSEVKLPSPPKVSQGRRKHRAARESHQSGRKH